MKDIRVELESLVKENHQTFKPIAEFLLEYEGDFSELKINEIAKRTYSSTAATTRLAQHLGLSGFTELKILLNNKDSRQYDYETNDVIETYMKELKDTLVKTVSQTNYQSILIAANVIHRCNKVILVGMGSSKLTLNDFSKKLLRLNINVVSQEDVHYQYVSVLNAQKNDVIVFSTYSGYTKEVIELIEIAKRKKLKYIVISTNKDLSSDDSLFLELPITENIIRGFSINSRTSQQILLDFIFIEIINNDKENYHILLNNARIVK